MAGRIVLLLSLFFVLSSCAGCSNEVVDWPADYLTAATDTGANTLSFMLNGTPWRAQNINLFYPITISSGFQNDTLTILAFRSRGTDGDGSSSLSINLFDPLIRKSFQVDSPGTQVTYMRGSNNTYILDTTQPRELILSRCDTILGIGGRGIASGTFFFTVTDSNHSEKLIITDGRFDVPFNVIY
jgi:hypothetical protein